MGATVFEIAARPPPPTPLVKSVGTKRLGKGRVKVMMKGSMVFNSDHLENSLITSQNPSKNQIYGLRVGWGKISMVRQSESDDIFVCIVKAMERMITGSSVLLYPFHYKIKMFIFSPWAS